MSDSNTSSLGVVSTETVNIDLPEGGFTLENGDTIDELVVAFERYGEVSPEKDNVIFICHALSGDAHVAGQHDPNDPKTRGWWDVMVGPGMGIDTDHYHVICANVLGGCRGTTGPSSVNPRTGKPYGSSFPEITVRDIVAVHMELLKALSITHLAAVIGGSFGGMQVLEWAIRYPDFVDRCICVASAYSLSSQALAFDAVGRNAIQSDPGWQNGDYYGRDDQPERGLALARQIGHITYLSSEMMAEKFGREKRENDAVFEVDSYLEHQGRKFVARFDANSYLTITRAMDEYDLGKHPGGVSAAFEPIRASMLIVALSSDWLFPPEQSIELAHSLLTAGKSVSYCQLHAPHGHDAFLVDIEHLSKLIRAFLPWVGPRHGGAQPEPSVDKERLCRIIETMVPEGSRVLDLGCGDGYMLSRLTGARNVSGIGVDIDLNNVIRVVDKGHDIFQGDIDAGLAMIPDNTYDCAILSETLQVVRKPRLVLREMLRVAKRGIVTFPNFGKWDYRARLSLSGRMPKGGSLPFDWYNTPNIHLFTRNDFIELCRQDGIRVLDMVCIPRGFLSRILVGIHWCNLGADRVVAKIEKGTGASESCRSVES